MAYYVRGSTFLSQEVGENREGDVLRVLFGGESTVIETEWTMQVRVSKLLAFSSLLPAVVVSESYSNCASSRGVLCTPVTFSRVFPLERVQFHPSAFYI